MEVGVYGLGRFGYYWASLLSKHLTVKGYSRNPERKTPEGIDRVSENELLKLPVLFICTAISAFDEVVRRIAGRLKPGSLLLDTCSVKIHPVKIMEKYISTDVDVLATHPMFGPDSARNGVAGFPIILCPVRISDGRMDYWKRFFQSLGMKIVLMSPQEHDYEAAFTQGITHYIGRVLSDLNLKPSDIATLGYRNLLAIMDQTCNDPWQLFLDLHRYNPHTRQMRDRLHESLERVMTKLEKPPLDILPND